MSKIHNPVVIKDQEHGNMTAYTIGFILSLVFTLIPYYLVVNLTISGTALLLTILGFAVLQMVVQLTFFIHLGRGPKPKWNLFFFISTVGIILVVVGGSIMIINNLHYNMSPSDQTKRLLGGESIYQINGQNTGVCRGQFNNYQVTIKDNQVTPKLTIASKCDTLTFINDDKEQKDIAFGKHPQHDVYAGVMDLIVRKGYGKTITLSEPGTIKFHDHLHPETTGTFTVTNF